MSDEIDGAAFAKAIATNDKAVILQTFKQLGDAMKRKNDFIRRFRAVTDVGPETPIANCAMCAHGGVTREPPYFEDTETESGIVASRITCGRCWQSVSSPIASKGDKTRLPALLSWNMVQFAQREILADADVANRRSDALAKMAENDAGMI